MNPTNDDTLRKMDIINNKIANQISLTQEEAQFYIDNNTEGADMGKKRTENKKKHNRNIQSDAVNVSTSGDIRDAASEVKKLKLNVKISANQSDPTVLDVRLYNIMKEITYVKMAEGLSVDIFTMYRKEYEMAVYSRSRSQDEDALDDFKVTLQAYDSETNTTLGPVVMLQDITVVDEGLIFGDTAVPPKADTSKDIQIGSMGPWRLFKAENREYYYFINDKKKRISGKSLQTTVEKYALSVENLGMQSIFEIQEAFGLTSEVFTNDMTMVTRSEEVRTALKKMAAEDKLPFVDYIGNLVVTALREVSPHQKELILKELENQRDPEKDADVQIAI